MKYTYKGCEIVPGCTPAPLTMFDNRSCRERTGCKKECIPKKLKCEHCEQMFSRLNVLEDENGKRIYVCDQCEKEIERED
jgi:hypothetical protein